MDRIASLTPLLQELLTHWTGDNEIVATDAGTHELVSRVATTLLAGAATATEEELTQCLTNLSITEAGNPALTEKITKFTSILQRVHLSSYSEIMTELGLDTWSAGPETREAKLEIVKCYLIQSHTLNLSSKDLTSLPACIGTFPLLKTLNCSDNLLTALPALPFVNFLYCSGNQLTALPALPLATSLNCDNNQLTALPALPLATSLNCSGNQLTALPALPLATSLNCHSNQLTALPALPLATSLDCDNNQLTALPALPLATFLICNRNQLTALPALPFVNFLECSCNQLTALPDLPNCSRPYWLPQNLPIAHLPLEAVEHVAIDLPAAGQSEGKTPWLRILPHYLAKEHSSEETPLTLPLGDRSWCIPGHDGCLVYIQSASIDDGTLEIMIDAGGQVISANAKSVDVKDDLDNVETLWGKKLDGCLRAALIEGGIYKDGTSIRVHDLTIKKCPERVLAKISDILSGESPIFVRFLKDDFTPDPGMDMGGPSRKFMFDLCKALFDSTSARPGQIKADDDLPTLPSLDASPEKIVYNGLGSIISYILGKGAENQLRSGPILPEVFYELLKEAASPEGDRNSVLEKIVTLKLTDDPNQLNFAAWYRGDVGANKTSAIEYFALSGEDLPHEATDDEIKALMKKYLGDLYGTYLNAVLGVHEGLTPSAKLTMQTISPSDLCLRVQGNPLTADQIISAFRLPAAHPPAFQQRIEWLKEIIREKSAASNTEWLEKFLVFMTGTGSITTATKLNFKPNAATGHEKDYFNSHTCINQLEIPLTAATDTKAPFINLLELSMETPTFTTS